MIEPQLVFGGFETVLDRPTMAFDFRQRFDRRSNRRPCSEEGEIAVDDLATNQQSARPGFAAPRLVIFAAGEIGELEIGPIMQPLAFRSRAGRKTLPSGQRQAIGDLFRRARDGARLASGVERVVGSHAQHIVFPGAP